MDATIVIPTDTELGLSEVSREGLTLALAVEADRRRRAIEETVKKLRDAAKADRRSSLIIIPGAP